MPFSIQPPFHQMCSVVTAWGQQAGIKDPAAPCHLCSQYLLAG